MLEIIIRKSSRIVDSTERLVDKTRRLVGSGSLDEAEAYELNNQVERLMDALFAVDEAVRLLRHKFECQPEIACAYAVYTTLQ